MQECLKVYFSENKKKKKITPQDISLNMHAIIAFFESFSIMSGVDKLKLEGNNEESKYDT